MKNDGFLVKINKLFVHIEIVHRPVRVILIKFIKLKLLHNPEVTNFLTGDFGDLGLIYYLQICSAELISVKYLSSMPE